MNSFLVEVAYATPAAQRLVQVTVSAGATVHDAIRASGILDEFPDIDLSASAVGIFSRRVGLDSPVSANDRVEIYRPLLVDPKDARRQRAKRGAS